MFEKICVREYLSPSNDLSDVYILLQIHLEKIKQKIQNLVVKYVPLELRKSSFKFKLWSHACLKQSNFYQITAIQL